MTSLIAALVLRWERRPRTLPAHKREHVVDAQLVHCGPESYGSELGGARRETLGRSRAAFWIMSHGGG